MHQRLHAKMSVSPINREFGIIHHQDLHRRSRNVVNVKDFFLSLYFVCVYVRMRMDKWILQRQNIGLSS